ncbi:MAG TPA: ATP-binding protein [Candidatus Angelobacter sp.]|nr:ATP-binding protein [Candidatus Angelobacter sp.]
MGNSLTAPDDRIAGLERLLEQRTAELREVRKELDGLSYSVSHDLRAPLRHIKGYAQILAEDCGAALGPECRQHLAKVQEGAQKMGEMLEELLKLSRLGRQPLERQAVSLEKLVREVIRDLKDKIAPRKVEWKIGELPVLECDPILTKQLFHHLLENALKFSRPRAHAVIEVSMVQQNGAVFFVRDNGIGFDMKYADKLFSVFQRLHPQQDFERHGAGLALAQRIVHRHGGRIWAEAAVEQGATFYFTLNDCSGERATPA